MESGHGGKREGAGRKAIHPPGRVKITVLLDPALADKLFSAAERAGEPVTKAASRAIEKGLMQAEKRKGTK